MRRRSTSPPPRAAGYSLVILLVILTGMTIAIAASLPLWSSVSRRDKEAELISRGLQYAEAIRVFRTRYGRAPVKLEELIEVKPRCIRQLWMDPMTEDGEWEIVLEGGPGGQINPNQPNQQGQQGPAGSPRGRNLSPQGRNQRNTGESGLPQSSGGAFANPDGRVVGPIAGVRSKSTEPALRVFMDNQTYDQWVFTYDMVSGHAALPDRAPIVASYRTLGRPFRPGLTPAVTLQPQPGGQGEDGRPARPPQGGNAGQIGRPTPGEGGRGQEGRPELVPQGEGEGQGRGSGLGQPQGSGRGLPTNPLGGSSGLGRPGGGRSRLQPAGRPNPNSGANPE